MLFFSEPILKYIKKYLYKKILKIFLVGFIRGSMELLSLIVVILYINFFIDIKVDLPIDLNLSNNYFILTSIIILIISFLTVYLSNFFVFNEGSKISKKHALDISKSFVGQSISELFNHKINKFQFTKTKVVSMICQETHRLNLNVNLTFIQLIFSILSILIIFVGLTLKFEYYIFIILLFFLILGLIVRIFITPLMRKGAQIQKKGHRKFLENYSYFAKSVFYQAVSGKISDYIEKVIFPFTEHNKGFNSNQVNGLNIKLSFEIIVFFSIVLLVYLDASYNFSDTAKAFLVANAIASLKVLPGAVSIIRNISIINSESLLVEEHNLYIETYLNEYDTNKSDLSFKNKNLVQKIFHNKNPVLLYGESGSGKTTLAKILAFNFFKDNKSVLFLDSDPIFDPEIEIKKVSDNLKQVHLNMLKLHDLANRFFNPSQTNFSRGQLQRIKLGMTLKDKFDVLILDEALNGIENILELEIINKLGKLAIMNNIKLIIISHSNNFILNSELKDFTKEKIGD